MAGPHQDEVASAAEASPAETLADAAAFLVRAASAAAAEASEVEAGASVVEAGASVVEAEASVEVAEASVVEAAGAVVAAAVDEGATDAETVKPNRKRVNRPSFFVPSGLRPPDGLLAW